MINNRWVINKFGLVDFWYYDHQEFTLSDGKLLFRGTNGSGKSVTMQSFIPLLLDGNKSPERLDPFGTRSRRLENYLLDENTEERIAYLYTEFKRQNTETYLTIGMGMKAQAGKPIDSWYFIINDGRRVGENIYLYKAFEEKVALTKKQLQNELGEACFFTESQQKYMAKVNELLFGYEEVDGYEELLSLLIQLRSPKLSKDFKPTEIYNILTSSLKVLSEDDLRPMSESMENMDQLQNSLEEKERALKAANNIKYHYDKYNRYCLFEKANNYDGMNKEVNEKIKQINLLIAQQTRLATEELENNESFDKVEKELQYAKDKYNSLQDNDGFKIKKRLQEIVNYIEELQKEISNKEKQLEAKKSDRRDKEYKQKDSEDSIEALLVQATRKLQELVEISEEFYFGEGEYLEKEVIKSIDTYDFSYLDDCLNKYLSKIKEVKKLLQEYEAAERSLILKQETVDSLKSQKEYTEEAVRKSNLMLGEVKEEFKDSYNRWSQDNKLFKLDREVLSKLFQFVNEVEGTGEGLSLSDLDAPVAIAYNHQKGSLITSGEFIKRSRRDIEKDIDTIKADIQALMQEKDIEPVREEGVLKNRTSLKQNNIPFIPLYKAIDFDKNTPEDTRRAIESALNEIGILDALIINSKDKEKALSFAEKHWDKYIFTAGNMMRHNLSSYCQVAKEELNGVDKEEVFNVLQSIFLDEDHVFSMDEKGNYVFGAIRGKASENYEPKYIGVLARKRHREQLIEQKKLEIEVLQGDIKELNNQLVSIAADMSLVEEEYKRRPLYKDIQEALNFVLINVRELISLENKLQKAEESFFEAQKEYSGLKAKLYEAAQGIGIEKTLKAYEAAEDALQNFKGKLSDVKVIQGNIKNQYSMMSMLKDDIDTLDLDIDNYYREIAVKKEKLNGFETEKKAQQDALSSFDIGTMEAEMNECIRISEVNPRKLQQLKMRSGEINTAIINIQQSLSEHKDMLTAKDAELKLAQEIFLEELGLKYVVVREPYNPLVLLKEILPIISEEDNKDKGYYLTKLIEAHQTNAGELREFNTKVITLFNEVVSIDINSFSNSRRRYDISCRVQGKDITLNSLVDIVKKDIEELKLLISTEERRIFEEVLLNTISSKISAKIYLSKQWVDKIDSLMSSMNTSSSLTLSLKWLPKKAEREDQLDIAMLLEVLERSGRTSDEDMRKLADHFGDKVKEAIRSYEETGEARNYHSIIKDVLDYRKWFEFRLYFTKKNEKRKELTNNAFFQFSGGEKAMSMYIPLFSAVYARYENARKDCPKIISLDEAFAGVDENNIRDMFRLLKELRLDYILNSQILWGDYDTVDNLSIYELIREENDDVVSVIPYHWNGVEKRCML
ncbi:MAG: TIGR02680 family protein [Clostridiales bacterium GWB2_37_7]|nr:MAG: TIGR02680 family protein [Clostridiales bacterium GWB2_37_7]